MSALRKLFILILIIFFECNSVFASSGGWVGNAPIAAYTPQVAFSSYSEEVRPETNEEWNSILLQKGQSKFSVFYNQCDTCSFYKNYINFNYDYGLTSNLTMFNFLTYGYSLKSGSGRGSELAFLFGLMGGLRYSSNLGTFLGPGVGLAYAYSENDWRLDVGVILRGDYNIDYSYWGGHKETINIAFTKWLSKQWAVGISTNYFYNSKYSKTTNCGTDCVVVEDAYSKNGFSDPKIFALYNLNENHEFGISYQAPLSRSESLLSFSYTYKW